MEIGNNVYPPSGMPQVALIVAMTRDHVIGSDKGTPWHLPEDLQLFKSLTMGGTVIMGRKTHMTIGHPLAGRNNIVLSQSKKSLPGVQVCNGFLEGLSAATQLGRPVFVIGGEEVYRKALPIASKLHISWVNGAFAGNRFFPFLDFSEWVVCSEKGYSDFHYIRYTRRISS